MNNVNKNEILKYYFLYQQSLICFVSITTNIADVSLKIIALILLLFFIIKDAEKLTRYSGPITLVVIVSFGGLSFSVMVTLKMYLKGKSGFNRRTEDMT